MKKFLLLLLIVVFTSCSARNAATPNNQSVNSTASDSVSSIASQAIENSTPHSGNSASSAVSQTVENAPIDDSTENKIEMNGELQNTQYVSCWSNYALSNDGILYSFALNDGKIVRTKIADSVKKLDKQLTNYPCPNFQTEDNQYFGISEQDGKLVEYKHNFKENYTLSGNNIVISDKNEVYRVKWLENEVANEDDFQYVMLGVDAVDWYTYFEGKEEFNTVVLYTDGTLYIRNSQNGTMNEVGFDVTKFYAGALDKHVGGSGIWYLDKDNILHILTNHSDGLNWDFEKIPHYRCADVLDFWRISSSTAMVLYKDYSLNIISTNGESTSTFNAQVPPELGVSDVIVLKYPWDNPDDIQHEYLLIDGSGKAFSPTKITLIAEH